MAIKKFSYWLATCSLLFSFFLLGACQSLRDGKNVEAPVPPVQEPMNNPYDPKTNQPVIKDSSMVSRSAPKLGLILGGGGVLTMAQVGVLHELTKQKVNIHSVVGMEWGALVGAAFSKTGRAHEVEWQLLKMPYKNFSNKSFFSSGSEGVGVDKFGTFLSGLFKKKRVESSKIPFACPYFNLAKAQTRMSKRGFFKNVLKACWPHPPQFSTSQVAANILGARDAVTFLRQQGAKLILYVDVIGNNVLMKSKQRKKNPQAALLWMQAKTMSSQLRDAGVNEVLSLSLSGGHLTSYESMRMMVRVGQMKSRGFIERFVKKYGY